MPKRPEPLNMVLAKKRKHYTKKDIEERRAREIDVPYKNIEAPAFLKGKLVKDFYDIAYKLLDIGVMTELDEDCLARYLVAQQQYESYSKLIMKALKDDDIIEASKFINIQDKLFKQVRTAAGDLGLTITSRCKLVVPNPPEKYVEL